MLSKEQIEILTDKYVTSLYDDLEREVIGDIARRVRKTERFTETAELMAQSLREQGYSTARIQAEVHKNLDADKAYQKAIAENTREYKQDVKKLIEETEEKALKAGDMLVATAGDMSWNDDMQLWKKHDVDFKKPNGLSQLYKAIAKQTNDELKNLTQSSGFKNTVLGTTGIYNAYQRTMDLAMVKVSSGAFSYQQAVKDCVDQLAKSGLKTIDYASGRSYALDTAARMCIRTGANQLSGKIQEMNLAQTDTPLVYVDAHAGSRPEHAVWQGQVYAYNPDGILKDGSKAGEKYGDFFNETDYGSPSGLMGVNCAHHFYPYWEGDPIPEYHEPDPVEIDGKEYSYYEATQEMRKQERDIRQTKREIEAMKNLGEDTTALQRKLSKQVQDYKGFSAKANINPRNYVLGVKNITNFGQANSRQNNKIVNAPKEHKKDRVIYDNITKGPDFFVGKNGKALPSAYKEWIGENQMDNLIKKAESNDLIGYIKTDFRRTSFIGDGSTAAIREFEIATGLNCGRDGRDHSTKIEDLKRQINKLLLKNLPQNDTIYLQDMLNRLRKVSK